MHWQHPAKKPCWDTNVEVQHSRLESAASRRNLLWIWVRTWMFRFTHTEHCSWSSRSQWILPVPHLAYCPPENFLRCQIPAAIQNDICSQLLGGYLWSLGQFCIRYPQPVGQLLFGANNELLEPLVMILSVSVCRTSPEPRNLNSLIDFSMSGGIKYGSSLSWSSTGPI